MAGEVSCLQTPPLLEFFEDSGVQEKEGNDVVFYSGGRQPFAKVCKNAVECTPPAADVNMM